MIVERRCASLIAGGLLLMLGSGCSRNLQKTEAMMVQPEHAHYHIHAVDVDHGHDHFGDDFGGHVHDHTHNAVNQSGPAGELTAKESIRGEDNDAESR